MQELIDGLPNLCGADALAEEVTRKQRPVYLADTNLRLDQLQSTFAVALHMQQPLIPAGGPNLQTAEIISNLDFMMHQGGDSYNASVFADCYGRIGDIVPELVREGKHPRVMLDYSGELLYGLRRMGRGDVLDRLRGITCDPHLRRHAEWLGTMWGHAVASSTPLPDLKLHMRAWQHNFAAIFGWDALARVRGFSPPEMHLPNHPDAAYEYVKSLKECGYRWLLVQEHTVENMDGQSLAYKHLPHRLSARNSAGAEASIIAIIKTQGSDTKLVAQMQPFYESQGLQRQTVGGISIPPIVTQIGDGENGGVMMNEFSPRLPPGDSAHWRRGDRCGKRHRISGTDRASRRHRIDAAGVSADPPGAGARADHQVGTRGRRQGDHRLETREAAILNGRRLVDKQHQLGVRL